MRKIKNISLMAVSVFALVVFGTSGLASAHDGTSSDDSSSSTSGSTNQLQQRLEDRQGRNSSRQASLSSDASSSASTTSELRKKAEDDISEKKKQVKEHSQEERQKKCEQRKHGIQTKFDRISTNSQKIQDRIDGVLDKAIAYADKNNLNNGDIADLVTKANEAKSKSAASVANLKALQPTIDCTSNNVPSDIATFKAAAKEASDNIKSYRTAVKNLLKALIDASKTSNPTGNSDSSNSSQEGAAQ